VDGQLGLEKTPEEYVANMVAVFREVRRVLKDDGVLFLNLASSYVSSYIESYEYIIRPDIPEWERNKALRAIAVAITTAMPEVRGPNAPPEQDVRGLPLSESSEAGELPLSHVPEMREENLRLTRRK
jgi:hypothetical protein